MQTDSREPEPGKPSDVGKIPAGQRIQQFDALGVAVEKRALLHT
jgi:hypothetical protein